MPFAEHFRAQGWRVDALANGAAAERAHRRTRSTTRFDVALEPQPARPAQPRSARRPRCARSSRRAATTSCTCTRRSPRSSRATPCARCARARAARRHLHRPRLPLLRGRRARRQRALPHAWSASPRRGPTTSSPSTARTSRRRERLGGIAAERVRYIPGIGVDTRALRARGASSAERGRRGPRGTRRRRRRLHAHDGRRVRAGEAPRACCSRRSRRCADPRVVLVLVGDGPLESQLREKAVALRLAERVRWAGYRRDIPAVLAASDALAARERARGPEPLGARGDGRRQPVIGTDTRGIADAVGADAGWIVAKNDAGGARRARSTTAAADPDEAARRGAAARERAVRGVRTAPHHRGLRGAVP